MIKNNYHKVDVIRFKFNYIIFLNTESQMYGKYIEKYLYTRYMFKYMLINKNEIRGLNRFI